MVFFGKPRHQAVEHAEESPPVITVPLMILAGLSVVGGVLNLPSLHTFTHWLEHTFEPFDVHLHAAEFNPRVALISTLLALGAIALAWLLYGRKPLQKGEEDPLSILLGPVFTGMNRKWYVDEIYEFLFINRYIDLARFLSQKLDWDFWHDWFHDSILVAGFNKMARFLADPVDLGLIDGIAHLKPKMQERFGEKVKFRRYGVRKPIWTRFGASLAQDAIAGLEERAAFARFGL
jgi:NADH:ubiquinone oxidoreductase subunit 5 (subunit L)/multisubunit Na+/H+ antiporter MnhA subunit